MTTHKHTLFFGVLMSVSLCLPSIGSATEAKTDDGVSLATGVATPSPSSNNEKPALSSRDPDAHTMANEIAETGRIAIYGIYFDTGQSTIKPQSKASLDNIATLLREQHGLRLVVMGHTDNQGSDKFNVTLSRQRAIAVCDTLINEYGIDDDRLIPWGVGSFAPAAKNDTADGRAINRRVVLLEYKTSND